MSSKFSPTPAIQQAPPVCKPPPTFLPIIPAASHGPMHLSVSWKGETPDLPNPPLHYNHTNAAWSTYGLTSGFWRWDFTDILDSMRLTMIPQLALNNCYFVATHWIMGLPVQGTTWYAEWVRPGTLYTHDHLYQESSPHPLRFSYHFHT